MNVRNSMSRRQFLQYTGMTAAATALAACAAPAMPVVPAAGEGAAAPAAEGKTVRIAVGGWAEQNMKDLLAQPTSPRRPGSTSKSCCAPTPKRRN